MTILGYSENVCFPGLFQLPEFTFIQNNLKSSFVNGFEQSGILIHWEFDCKKHGEVRSLKSQLFKWADDTQKAGRTDLLPVL